MEDEYALVSVKPEGSGSFLSQPASGHFLNVYAQQLMEGAALTSHTDVGSWAASRALDELEAARASEHLAIAVYAARPPRISTASAGLIVRALQSAGVQGVDELDLVGVVATASLDRPDVHSVSTPDEAGEALRELVMDASSSGRPVLGFFEPAPDEGMSLPSATVDLSVDITKGSGRPPIWDVEEVIRGSGRPPVWGEESD